MVLVLDGVVRHYDWGSTSSLPSLLGRPEDGRPWAELWFGAHPSAPSLAGPDRMPLDQVIGGDPVGALGAAVHDQFGGLPFLLKVLAAGHPLSLQAHPSSAQAKAGFAREDAAGIPVDAPHRSFRDRNHKPELICALTPFDALCGFRSPTRRLRFWQRLTRLRLMIFGAASAQSMGTACMHFFASCSRSSPARPQRWSAPLLRRARIPALTSMPTSGRWLSRLASATRATQES